jgi:hypothetical protein
VGKRGTRSEYARHAGVAPSYVTKLARAGRLVLVKGDDGREVVDFALTDRMVRNTTDLGRANNGKNLKGGPKPADTGLSKRPTGDVLPSTPTQPPAAGRAAAPTAPPPPEVARHDVLFRQAQTQQRVFDAKRAQLLYEREADKFWTRESVERGVADAFRKLQERAFSVPRAAAHRIVGLVEQREIEQVIDAELRKAFADWDGRLRAEMQERFSA